MQAYERLIRYAKVATASDPGQECCPSSKGQAVLAQLLKNELVQLGLIDARVDENGYVYASLPASCGLEAKRPIGFIAHMDTSPDAPGEGVEPMLWPDYDGGLLQLPEKGVKLDPAVLCHLPKLAGKTLITSAGNTLLGADDKAGIAEIMTMLERLQKEQRPHPTVAVAFTPDEEIGRGAARFDLSAFAAPVAYTVDGGEPGVVEYETFNAAQAVVTIHGVSVHPGTAKGVMKNAALMATEFAGLLPANEIPAATEGYEGFFHLHDLQANVSEARLQYLIRDHDADRFEERKKLFDRLAEQLNAKWGEGTVEVTVTDSYYNMAQVLKDHMDLVEAALEVSKNLGFPARCEPVRGGTDGSMLSFMGLPCPNLPTGGWCYHGPQEHITVEDMDICCEILLGLVDKAAK